MWTHFWDMHSGGGQKAQWAHIYIEAPEEEAKVIFYNRFGHNPERVSCTCCGEDYSISSRESLTQLTGYERGCRTLETPRGKDGRYLNDDPVIKAHLYLEADEAPPEGYKLSNQGTFGREYISMEDWLRLDGLTEGPDVRRGLVGSESFKLIRAVDIKPDERQGEVPEQGYVWQD